MHPVIRIACFSSTLVCLGNSILFYLTALFLVINLRFCTHLVRNYVPGLCVKVHLSCQSKSESFVELKLSLILFPHCPRSSKKLVLEEHIA
eukprot:1142381-Pelagomonas_calceolata.AAC.1